MAGGAEICCGGEARIENLLSTHGPARAASQSAKVSTQEVFGPVVCVYAYDDLDEAIARANHPAFSFHAAIFTRDLNTAFRAYDLLDASAVIVNDHTAFRVDWMPFAGLRQSGPGRRRHSLYVSRHAIRKDVRGGHDMKIKAAVLNAIGAKSPYAESKPLTVEDVELAPPGHGEVLVKIGAAGLCHSDLSVINGDRPRPMPMALGHEAAGIVEALGEGVTDLQRRRSRRAGVRAELRPLRPVRRRPPCPVRTGRRGQRRRHAAVRRAAPRARWRSRSTITSAARCSPSTRRCRAVRVVKIDPELPLDEAALFGCAVLTGVGAVVNTAQVRAGASVAVIGLGGVGLAALLGAGGRGRAADHRRGPVGRQAASWRSRWAPPTSSTPAKPTALEQIRDADLGRCRIRVRVRRLGARARTGLPHHAPRRHDGHRRAAAADRDVRRCPPSTWWPKNERSRAATSAPACPRATYRATSTCTRRGACR